MLMFYEHNRKWFTTSNNFNNILNLLESRLGDPLTIEDVDVIFLEGDIRYLRIQENDNTTTLLNIKAKVLNEAFVEMTYRADESVYLDALARADLLPRLKKRRYAWEIVREGRLLFVYLDLYGESDFLRVKLTERSSDIGFSKFVREYKVDLENIVDVSYKDSFRDKEIARLLFQNNYDYAKAESILVFRAEG